MLAWKNTEVKSSTSETHLRPTSLEKMWWQTQHSADFVNWLSIKGLLSQKQACHVAKSWFVWYLSTWACKILAWKKKITRVGRYLKGFLQCRSDQMAEWTSSYSWFFKGQREDPPPPQWSFHPVKRKTHSKHQCHGGCTDWTRMQGKKQLGPVHFDKIRWNTDKDTIKRIHRDLTNKVHYKRLNDLCKKA